MPFKDTQEGQTHYFGDECGIAEHNMQVTCLSLDCPERKSLCCGAHSEAAPINNESYDFQCSQCKKKFMGGECNAVAKFDNPTVQILTDLLAKMESCNDARECRHVLKDKILELL